MLVREKGWRIVSAGRGRHAKLITPNGRKTTIPGSPSDWRAFKNFKRDTAHLAQEPDAKLGAGPRKI